MKKSVVFFKITFFVLIALFSSCNRQEELTMPETRGEQKETILDSAVMKEVPIVEVDMKIFNKQKNSTKELVGSLLEGSVDFTSTTVNYFKIDEHDTTGFQLTEDDTPLSIIDFGPVGKLPEEMQKPAIYVMFSQPMVPLSKLGEPMKSNKFLTIDPPLEGTFRWYGTKLLTMDVDKPILADSEGYSKEYTVLVSGNIKSLGGKSLGENHLFSFYPKEVEMVNLFIPTDSKGSLGRTSNVPFDLAGKAVVRFNMPVDIDSISKGMSISVNGSNKTFTLTRPDDDETRIDRSVQVNFPSGTVFTNNNQIVITLMEGAVPREGTPSTTKEQTRSYSTLNPFKFNHMSTYSYSTPSLPKGNRYPVYLNFNQTIDKNQNLKSLVTTSLGMDLSDKIHVYGSVIHISNLPVESGDNYTINVSNNLKDVYGQTLSKGTGVINVEVPEANSYIMFPDKSYGSGYSTRIGYLESQFPPGLIIQHQNIESLNYGNKKIQSIISSSNKTGISPVDIGDARKNYANFEFVDLEGQMNSAGNGSVIFSAEARLKNYWDDEIDIQQDNILLQVTDIGISVRYGYNKILVWSNSLKDGAPVSGAEVRLYSREKDLKYTQKSNSDGLAVFNLRPGEFNSTFAYYYDNSESERKSFWIAVETRDDKAELEVFSNQWGINRRQAKYAESPIDRILIFSDRKLYKPGEELSYRGIHWEQLLGDFEPNKGSYTLKLRSMGYDSKTLYTETGKTSDTGGFYGTFTLPENIKPGEYYLEYNSGNSRSNAIIQIAFFRRLNFAVSSSTPDRTFFSGDTISIPIKAYYLSGGAMPGAGYDYFWTRKMTGFKPPGERWKPYIFGMRNYAAEKTLGTGNGQLSVSGEAQIKQEAIDHEKAGATYRYILETTVTDIDNQQVSSTASLLVHPSSYYIGAKLGNDSSYYWSRFIKVKKKAQLQMILVSPDGEIYSNGTEIMAEMYKISWKSSYQQGVYDRVNVSYTKTEELVDTLKTTIGKDGTGKLEIVPPSSGSYILKIKSADLEGRPVQTEMSYYAYGGGWYYWGGDSEKINLVPDRDLYFVGDKAQIMVQSPLKKGKYLLTVEREGIVKESVIELDEDTNMVEIPIEEGYIPRIYVALSSFTNREEAPESYFAPDLGKPKNLFGVTSLNVSNITRTVDVEVVATKDSYRPGEEAEVYIKVTKNGEPVAGTELIYLAVDRGVVDLVNYHVPNPLTYFYNPNNFYLYTSGDDLRNYLMDPVSYDISSLQGGDGTKMEERKDFNPLAAFEPYLLTDANGIAKVSFKLPDTLTRYRSTAIALKGNNIGYSENEVLVKNPINVRTAFPRRLRHRDTGVGDIVLQNNTAEEQEVKLSLSSDGIKIPGESSKSVIVPGGSVFKVPFLLVPEQFGEFEVVITVNSSVLNERLIQKVIVERPLTKEAFATTGTVNSPIPDKEGFYAEEGLLIPEKIAPGYGSYSLSLYASRLGMLKAPINGLKNYHWYSLSEYIYRYMPDAVLGKTMETLDFSYDKPKVEQTLKMMKTRQVSPGWIKYWSSQSKQNKYMDSLALLFTIYAEDSGVKIPSGLKSGLASALVSSYRKEEDLGTSAAYTAYILNKAGKDVSFMVDSLLTKDDALGLTGYSYLVITLKKMGRDRDAKKIWQKAKNFVRLGTRTVDINETYERRWYFDSEIRQIASLSWAGLMMDEDSEILQRYLNTLEQRFNGATWRSRTDYLWSVIAMKAFVDEDSIDSINLKTKVLLNNQEVGNKAMKSFDDSTLDLNFPIFDAPLADLPKGELQPLRIEKEGTGNLYYAAQIEYALPSEISLPRDEGISVFLQYETLEGEQVEPDKIETGTTYRIKVVISSNRRRSYLSLDVPVPSGIEIIDPSFATTSSYKPEGGVNDETWSRETSYGDEYEFSGEGYGYYDHYFGNFWWYWKNEPDQEIYDNHLTYSWETFYEGKRELTFLVRATSAGIYPTPPAQATLLFEPEVFGRTGGSLFVIQ